MTDSSPEARASAVGRVTALNPLVRRAISYETDDLLPISGESEVPDCPDCGGLGLRPAGADRMVGCHACRSEKLQLLVLRPEGFATWIACRDLPGAWGRGCSPVEAVLDMEGRIEESLSMFGHRFLRRQALVPLKCYLRKEEMEQLLACSREAGMTLPEFVRLRLLSASPVANRATGDAG